MRHKNLMIWPDDLPLELYHIKSRVDAEDWQRARELLANRLANSKDHDSTKAMLHNNLGVVYQQLGLYNFAAQNYQAAESLATQLGSDILKGIANYSLGHLFFAEARWDEAAQNVELAIEHLRSAGKYDFESVAQDLLRSIQAGRQHMVKLLGAYTEHSSDKASDKVARLREVARIYSSAGAFVEAINQLEEALGLSTAEGLNSLEAIILNDMAAVYQTHGLYGGAEVHLQKALKKATDINDSKTEATVRNNYGLLLKQLGKLDQAIEMLQQALTIRRQLREVARTGNILYNLASTYYADRSLKRALEYAQEALNVDSEHNPGSIQSDRELIQRITSELFQRETKDVEDQDDQSA